MNERNGATQQARISRFQLISATNLAQPEPTGSAVFFLNLPNSHLYFTFFGMFGLCGWCVHCTEYLCIPRVSSDFLQTTRISHLCLLIRSLRHIIYKENFPPMPRQIVMLLKRQLSQKFTVKAPNFDRVFKKNIFLLHIFVM